MVALLTGPAQTAEGLATLAVVFFLYLLPVWVALFRGHPQSGPIFVITLFTGWTCLGWALALAWSVGQVEPRPLEWILGRWGSPRRG